MLPNIKPERQCTAKSKRSGMRCKNPAKGDGKVCRLHGWVDSVRRPRGEKHGRYIHGRYTKEGIVEARRILNELSQIEVIGFAIGMFVGAKTRGRKTKKPK